MRCQFIKINNNKNNNEVFIHLYQYNNQKPAFSYLMLIQKRDNPQNNESKYSYIDSITSMKSKRKDYESHIALNKIILEKGTYYICCDVNYRFDYKDEAINGYSLKIISQKKIKVQNVTRNFQENNKMLQESLIEFIENQRCEDYKISKNYAATYVRNFRNHGLFPFDIYYFHNIEEKNVKVLFQIPEGSKKLYYYCIYNDDETSEIENSLMKELTPNQKKIIMVMHYNSSLEINKYNENNLEIEIDREKYLKFIHPVFNNNNVVDNKFKDVIEYFKEIMIKKKNKDLGIILARKNISPKECLVQLNLEGYFIINPKEWDFKKNIYQFNLEKEKEKIICIRKIPGVEIKDKPYQFSFN